MSDFEKLKVITKAKKLQSPDSEIPYLEHH
jgi:hypothetical protein